jgi:hypothetical protein
MQAVDIRLIFALSSKRAGPLAMPIRRRRHGHMERGGTGVTCRMVPSGVGRAGSATGLSGTPVRSHQRHRRSRASRYGHPSASGRCAEVQPLSPSASVLVFSWPLFRDTLSNGEVLDWHCCWRPIYLRVHEWDKSRSDAQRESQSGDHRRVRNLRIHGCRRPVGLCLVRPFASKQ